MALVMSWSAPRGHVLVDHRGALAVASHLGHQVPEPSAALLKPSPHLITQAVGALDAEPGECTLVGDSVTDIQAARLASVHSIGYANEPGKRERLTAVGAGAIITASPTSRSGSAHA